MNATKRNAPAAVTARGVKAVHGEANASILLGKLEGVQPAGEGWRAKCPACGGRSRKIAISQAGDKVLLHCFGGCKPDEVLRAVNLTWGDVMPARFWPESPAERRRAKRSIQEAGWAAALSELTVEANVVRLAAEQLLSDEPLDWDDFLRLVQASDRIDRAAELLTEAR